MRFDVPYQDDTKIRLVIFHNNSNKTKKKSPDFVIPRLPPPQKKGCFPKSQRIGPMDFSRATVRGSDRNYMEVNSPVDMVNIP